jgi:hypothetical protein
VTLAPGEGRGGPVVIGLVEQIDRVSAWTVKLQQPSFNRIERCFQGKLVKGKPGLVEPIDGASA